MKTFKDFLIYCIIVLVPFYFFRFSILGIKTNIFEVFVFILLLISLQSIVKEKIRVGCDVKKWLLPIIFLFIALASVLFADDKIKALGIFKGWFLAPILFAWLIEKSFNKKNIYNLIAPVYFSLLIVSLWAVLQKFGFITTLFYQVGDSSFAQYIKEGRVFGPFESPNFLVMFIVPTFFLALPIIEQLKKKWAKFAVLVSFLIPLFALYASGSRAGYVAFFICLMVFLNYRFVNSQKSNVRRPFLVGIFIFMFIIINIGYLFFTTNHYETTNGGDMVRIEIYKNSLLLLKGNFITGIGLGNFQNKISELTIGNSAFHDFALPYALHPHNLFLALWLNLGLVGLIVFIWILVNILNRLFFNDSKLKAYLLASIFAILIHGLFDTTYFKNDLSAVFWLIFAFPLIIEKKNEEIVC